jgi:Methyltransferase domain
LKARLRRNWLVLFLLRVRALWHERRSAFREPRASLRYLFGGRELSTFTYDLANSAELAEFIANALGVETSLVARYFDELEQDAELRGALAEGLRTHSNRHNIHHYTKRIGYYAIVRITKPAVVVETGTHHGLGAAVIARALQRNSMERDPPGKVLTFDINPDAGWLIPSFLDEFVQQFTGPSRATLGPALEANPVDFFVHDSLRTPENERFEFETVISHAAGPKLVLVTDHAPKTYVLRDICAERGAWYGAFQEVPQDHFFAGVELGLGIMEAHRS